MTAAPVIRRVVLWRWLDRTTPAEKLRAKEGLAYVSFASPVEAVDFGEDLGVASGNYDLALLRDHRDKTSWDAYKDDIHHYRVGNYIDTLTHEPLTARADYLCSARASVRGRVRHLALYSWREDADVARKREARLMLAALRIDCEHVEALDIADDLGWASIGRADLVVEAQFADDGAARAFLRDPDYLEAEGYLATLTHADRTARIQHRMVSG